MSPVNSNKVYVFKNFVVNAKINSNIFKNRVHIVHIQFDCQATFCLHPFKKQCRQLKRVGTGLCACPRKSQKVSLNLLPLNLIFSIDILKAIYYNN